jgi:putative membrane protein
MELSRKQNYIGTLCATLLLSSGLAVGAQSGDAGTASPADKHFVTAALKGGMAEVKLGQMAADKGSSQDVKDFGQKMVEDHTKLGDQMKQVAGQIGVDAPSMMAPTDEALEAKLKLLSGDAFDKAYISAMVKGHRADLMAFKKEAADGSSPAVKSAAADGEKVVAEHLHMIRKIAQSHDVGTSNSAKPAAGGE